MNRVFKRKLVFVKVCSLFSFIRCTNAEKIQKKQRRPQEPILSPRFTSLVQSSPVCEIQYAVKTSRFHYSIWATPK